tara:strand:- start:8093 stop:8284 length:192 start_codon:yes stop_codon:yes gene_type:complete
METSKTIREKDKTSERKRSKTTGWIGITITQRIRKAPNATAKSELLVKILNLAKKLFIHEHLF